MLRLRTLSRHLSPTLSRNMSWHAAHPTPKSSPAEISAQDVAALPGTPGVDYLVVDVRRTDIIGVRPPPLCADDRTTTRPAP